MGVAPMANTNPTSDARRVVVDDHARNTLRGTAARYLTANWFPAHFDDDEHVAAARHHWHRVRTFAALLDEIGWEQDGGRDLYFLTLTNELAEVLDKERADAVKCIRIEEDDRKRLLAGELH